MFKSSEHRLKINSCASRGSLYFTGSGAEDVKSLQSNRKKEVGLDGWVNTALNGQDHGSSQL